MSFLGFGPSHTQNGGAGKTEQTGAAHYNWRRPMDPESSIELLHRAQAGDDTALNELLARYRPRLRRWASGRLPRYARDMTDTDDLVQDVMVGTFRNFKAFEQRGEWALQAYLRQAVSNRIRDELRRNATAPKREALPEGVPAPDASPLEAAAGRETFGRYERALLQLDALEQEAVIARLELGCSFQEIAALVDKPTPDAARMMVARAVSRLAQLMT
jgi:RNA polymerase sigma factor (sigma-70 family)